MAILNSRISYYGNSGLRPEKVLTDWSRITIKRGLDTTSNTIDIQLKNGIKKLLSDGTVIHKHVNDNKELSIDNPLVLAQGDVVKLWFRWSNSASDTIDYTDSSSQLIATSEIKEWDCVLEDNKTTLVLKGVDKSYEVLNKLWVSAYTYSLGLTCPTMAQIVLQNATDGVGNIYGYDSAGNFTTPAIYSVDARLMSGTYTQQAALNSAATGDPPAYIQSKRIDNSAYPVIQMTKVWKPVYEWLTEINDIRNTNSSTEISNNAPIQDRNNRFYIDQKNRYHQFYPEDTVDYTLVAGVNDDDGTITSFKMTKKTFDIINMVIFNCGKDLDNVGILWYYYDRTSKEKKLKMKYMPMLEIASEGNGSLRSQEVTAGNITVASDGVVTIVNSSGTTSWGESYSSSSDYKNKFRLRARLEGERRAKAITVGRGNPRWKGSIELKRGAYYSPGQLVNLTATSHGINQQLVRITDVTHQITPTQWRTTLDVEQDEPKYGETI